MEQLARRIADAIGNSMGQDEEKRQVIAYGLTALFQMFVIFILVFSIGLIGDFAIESLVLFLGVGVLKKSIGGAHAKTMRSCLIISVSFITLLSFVSRYFILLPYNYLVVIAFILLAYLFSFILIYRLAPVDSPNKPIVKRDKIKRLRKEAFITFFIYFTASAVLLSFYKLNYRCLTVAVSFSLATIWQSFMLTKSGHVFIAGIDRILCFKSS